MKYFLYLLIICISVACGSSNKAIVSSTPETPEVITETRVELPEPVVIEEDSDVEVLKEDLDTSTEIENTVNNEIPIPEEVEMVTDKIDHGPLNEILARYVSSQGVVNYAGIKNNWSALRGYIKQLGTTVPEDTWSQEEKLSYWMNAYNAMTIDLILRNYPLESIKDIKDPWDQRFWKLGDKWYNLNEIEHKILRKMGDARIHFGINCASFSCPPLLNEAFTPDKVDKQLDTLARNFINDTDRNTIASDRVDVSKIFTWFAKDFKTDGSLIDYLNRYASIKIKDNAKVRYRDYDWTLNN